MGMEGWRGTRSGAAAATAVMLLATAACGVGERREAAGGGGGDTLRVVSPMEVHDLAPATSDALFTRLEVTETLVTSDLQGELAPGLAESWESPDGGRTWEFALPDGATFHDGTPVTGEAVAEALTRAAEEAASPLADTPLQEITCEGQDVTVRMSSPSLTLPAVLTHYSTSVLAPASYDESGAVTEVIGTGPYRIDSIELPASITTTAYDGWRGEQPEVERVSFQAVSRPETRALMAVGDQADVAFGLEPAGRQRVDAADGATMESTLQPRTILMKVDAEHPVLRDVRVRQALSMGLDRESMADAVLREGELAATQLLPPSLEQWNDPGLEPLEHDVAAARALLEEAGWSAGADGMMQRDGEPLRLTLTTYPDRPELPALATTIQAGLREIGDDLRVDVTNSSEISSRHADDSLELGLLARHFALVSDPLVTVADTFAPDGADFGAMNWRDDEVGAALDELLAGASGARAEELRAVVTTTAQEELPLIPVAWYRMNAAVSERVDGFVIDPLESSWRISEVSWAR